MNNNNTSQSHSFLENISKLTIFNFLKKILLEIKIFIIYIFKVIYQLYHHIYADCFKFIRGENILFV